MTTTHAPPAALLALDLDGTLIGPDGHPPPGLLDELREWQLGGAHVAVITARGRLPPLLRDWPLDSVSRCYGAWLRCEGRVLWKRTLPRPAVHAALGALTPAEWGDSCRTLIVTPDPSGILRHTDPDFRGRWPHAPAPLKVVHGQPDADRLDDLQAQWAVIPGAQVIRERRDRLVLVAADAGKGEALRDLAAHLGVPTTRTWAAGDGPADAAMLPHARTFLRVGAHPALHAAHLTAPGPADVPRVLARCRANALGCRA